MTDNKPNDEEVGARIRELVELGEVGDLRIIAFHESVSDVPGPVGSLLRMIAHVHNCYEEARALYGTTEGEANRLFAVLEEAMSTLDAVRAGEVQ